MAEQLKKGLGMWQKRMLVSLQRSNLRQQPMTLNELVKRMAGRSRASVYIELSTLIAEGLVLTRPYRLRPGLHIDKQGRLWERVADYAEVDDEGHI